MQYGEFCDLIVYVDDECFGTRPSTEPLSQLEIEHFNEVLDAIGQSKIEFKNIASGE